MTQLSLSPWSALYDPVQNTVVATTTNTSLNSKFYAKLIASLEGQALQNMVARKHIRANGVDTYYNIFQELLDDLSEADDVLCLF